MGSMKNHYIAVSRTQSLVFIIWKNEQPVSAPFYETKGK
jgi:hypothetical protein